MGVGRFAPIVVKLIYYISYIIIYSTCCGGEPERRAIVESNVTRMLTIIILEAIKIAINHKTFNLTKEYSGVTD